MVPARMDRHNYMDVITQWLQAVHGKRNMLHQRVIQLLGKKINILFAEKFVNPTND